MMIYLGSISVNTYIKSKNPPKHSILLIVLYFLLVVIGGAFGFLWSEKELQSSQAKKSIATIIESEVSKARERLDRSVKQLYLARDKSIEQSVFYGNNYTTQEIHRMRAKEITELIEMQEERYEKELKSIANTFQVINQQK